MWSLRARLQPCGASHWRALRANELAALQNRGSSSPTLDICDADAAEGHSWAVSELLTTEAGQARCRDRAQWHLESGRVGQAALVSPLVSVPW